VNGKHAKLLLIIAFHNFATLENRLTYQCPSSWLVVITMKKKLADTKKKQRILAGPNEWQQVCNRSNPEKTGRSCEGVDFSWLSSKISRTLVRTWYKANNIIHRRDAWGQPSLESKWTYLLWMVSW
jgi:hypothetical protein